MNRTDWSLASCGNSEIDWVEPHPARVADLAAICDSCPIQRACAGLALRLLDSDDRVDLVGMWAGAWFPPARAINRKQREAARAQLVCTAQQELTRAASRSWQRSA